MIKARQFHKLLGLVGLAVLLLSSGITPATAQPLAPGRLTWQQSMAQQWAEDEWSNIEVSVGAWGFSRVGALGWLGQSWNVVVAPLDVDGDGDVDLAIEDPGYDTSQGYVFANDGTGLFAQQPAGDFDGSHSGYACELLASDLDADGDSDLIAGYCLEGTTGRANAVYINDGLGRFTRLSEGDFDDPLEETRALVVFDADGDGDRDVAVGNWLARNGLYLNDGSGRLWRTASGDFGDHIDRTYALAAADFDGDGDLDLAEGNHGLPSALYFNDGSGAFSHVDAGAFTGDARYTRSLAAADFDGDGDTDLAEGIAYSSNKLYLNSGGGQLVETEPCDFDEPSWQAADMVAFDADADGDVDLAVANDRVPADLYLNDGLGCFSRSPDFPSDSQPDQNSHVAAFDANGDAALDLAVGAALFLNQGNRAAFVDLAFAGFEAGNAGDLSGVSGYENAAVFDANGDGGQDVLMIAYYRGAGLYLHDGYGSYQLTEAGELDDFSTLPAVAFDADGDGDLDVACSGPNYLFLNDGSGVFTRGAPDDFAAAGAYSDLAAFDADLDGDVDLVGASPSRYYPSVLFLNDGTGVFTSAGTLGSSSQLTQELAPFDADGDGDIDLVELYPGWQSNVCRLLLNNGFGSFSLAASPPCRGYGTIFDGRTFDLDLDGDVDLIYDYYRYPARDFDLNLNDGTGHFTRVEGFDRGLPFTSGGFAVLDVDGDSDGDVVKSDAVYLNDGTGYFHPGISGDCLDLPGGQNIQAVDASLDGLPDLLFVAEPQQPPQVLCVNRGLYPEGTVTTDRIFPDRLYPETGRIEQYQTLEVEQLTPGDSAITYDVLDGLSNQPIPGYYRVLPDSAGQIDLRSIDAATYPIVRLRAKLMQGGGGETPQLRRWKLIFQMQYEPTSVGLQSFAAGGVSSEAVGLIWAAVVAACVAVLAGWCVVKRFVAEGGLNCPWL